MSRRDAGATPQPLPSRAIGIRPAAGVRRSCSTGSLSGYPSTQLSYAFQPVDLLRGGQGRSDSSACRSTAAFVCSGPASEHGPHEDREHGCDLWRLPCYSTSLSSLPSFPDPTFSRRRGCIGCVMWTTLREEPRSFSRWEHRLGLVSSIHESPHAVLVRVARC